MLDRLATELALAAVAVDHRSPTAVNKRSGKAFDAGLGPHSEAETLKLILDAALQSNGEWLLELAYSVPYPSTPRQRCDVRIRTAEGELFLEGKLLRLKGDNGKPNDNMLMHILSPYAQHRSALTDCLKLKASGFPGRKAVLIVGYSYPDIPLEPAVTAFEALARDRVKLGRRHQAGFSGLCHPVHKEGQVLAWEVE